MPAHSDVCIRERRGERGEEEAQQREQCEALSPKCPLIMAMRKVAGTGIFGLTADLWQRTVRKTPSLVFK